MRRLPSFVRHLARPAAVAFGAACTTALLCATAGSVTGQSPLGPMPEPAQNPSTPEKVMLGKFLFWDEQLSSDDSIACGTCHAPEAGGSDGRGYGIGAGTLQPAIGPGPDGNYGTADDIHGSAGVVRQRANGEFRPFAPFGFEPQVTRRVSPSNLGSGHHTTLFWDGRATSAFVDPETGITEIPYGGALESQSLMPIVNAGEMARQGRSWQLVRQKLQQVEPLHLASHLPADMAAAKQQNPDYPALFTAAYGDPAITAKRIAFALASYQRALNPDQTPWDQFVAGNPGALTALEQQGLALFDNQARCVACHPAPFFSDDQMHNLGLRPNLEDPGAAAISGLPIELGAFKTPSLRNAGLRPRLFHNGQSVALDDPAQLTDPASSLNIYLHGGGVDLSNIDPFLVDLSALGVTATDLLVVQEFVRTGLTDPRAAQALPPFDHPDLRSTVVAPARRYNTSLSGSSEPFVVDALPTYPGNQDFRLGFGGGDGSGLAVMTYGFQSIEPAWNFGPLPWSVQVAGWLPITLSGPAGAPGHATLPLPIPNQPALAQLAIYVQLFTDDPLAPNGIGASRGYEFVIR